ncbi:MAG: hypothetical protein VKN13_01295 [Cyanobacteriota bacterium]|nr:hypothetical protein [Cyanobacteriota bacterium]
MPSSLLPLAGLPPDHPCVWGDIEVRSSEPLVIVGGATVLPPRRNPLATGWWNRVGFGIYDAAGVPVASLNDCRGARQFFPPPAELSDEALVGQRIRQRDLVLYGGTLYPEYGHLLAETGRAYQLLRLYRKFKVKIWFHYPTTWRGRLRDNGMIQRWLANIGLDERYRIVRRPLRANTLISAAAIYRDRAFVSADFQPACQAALRPDRVRHILAWTGERRPVAYLSRHKLGAGSTRFLQEAELVEQLAGLPGVDVYCPEEMDEIQKILLYRQYRYLVCFPQASLMLKAFTPCRSNSELARQVILGAGPQSLPSSWINVDQACGFHDLFFDASAESPAPPEPSAEGAASADGVAFQRGNSFAVNRVLELIRQLAG